MRVEAQPEIQRQPVARPLILGKDSQRATDVGEERVRRGHLDHLGRFLVEEVVPNVRTIDVGFLMEPIELHAKLGGMGASRVGHRGPVVALTAKVPPGPVAGSSEHHQSAVDVARR